MKGTHVAAAMLIASTTLLAAIYWFTRPESAPKAERALAASPPKRTLRVPLPRELSDVEIGMDLGFLRKARPRAAVNPRAEEPLYYVYDERVSSRSRAVYLIRKRDLVLEKVQLASQLGGIEDIEPRVHANSNLYGPVSGVWDCPNRGAAYLATRRFTWRAGEASVMDVYLVVGEAVSATLYVAPQALIAESLRNASCVPTPADRLTSFPVPVRPAGR